MGALGGLVFALTGLVAIVVPDRKSLEAAVAADDVQVEGVTEAAFVELSVSMLTLVGRGLVVIGLAMLVLGIVYVVHRRRVRDRAVAGERPSDFLAHALLGAIVSGVTSFVPFSPVIGGGLAGYLERSDSERTIGVRTVSAVLLAAPFLVLDLFFAVGLGVGFAAIGEAAVGAMVAGLVVVSGAFSPGSSPMLGAGGGWIGGKLAERGTNG